MMTWKVVLVLMLTDVVFVLPALQAYFCCRDAGMRRGPSIVGAVARHTSRAAPSP